MSDVLKVTKENPVATVLLHRPEVRNAFDEELIVGLTNTFRDLSKDTDIKAIILKGSGESFCAGADLNWMKSMVNYSFDENIEDSKKLLQMFQSIENCPAPIVAHVHGHAMGGALGLLAVCDIVAASKETRFAFSEVKLGLAPSVIAPFILKKTSHSLVRESMLTGEMFSVERAHQMGLIHFYGTAEEVSDYVQSKVDFLLAAGRDAVRETKKLINNILVHDEAWSSEETVKLIAERRVSDEGQEGVKSFLEKRRPSWRD